MKLIPLFILTVLLHFNAFSQNGRLDIDAGANIHLLHSNASWDGVLTPSPYPSFYLGASHHIPISDKRYASVGLSFCGIAMNYHYDGKSQIEEGYIRSNFANIRFNFLGHYFNKKILKEFGIDVNIGFGVSQKLRNSGSTRHPDGSKQYTNESTLEMLGGNFSISPYWKFGNIPLNKGSISFKTAFSLGTGPHTHYVGLHSGIVYQIQPSDKQ